MNWIEITDQAGLDDLMDTFGSFHDACLREMHLWTGTWVQSNLSMSTGAGWDYHARLLFQRQWKNPSAIEISFDEVRSINIVSTPPNYDNSIYSATLLLEDGIFYLAEVDHWRPNNPDRNDITWIAANQMKWRDASNWMGSSMRYGLPEQIINSE